jgi:hypothetical protein
MNNAGDTAIAALDAEIAQLEDELDALRRARSVMASRAVSNKTVKQPTESPRTVGQRRATAIRSRMQPGSVGSIAIEILRDAGTPLPVSEILSRLHEKQSKGKKTSKATLVSTLCTYMNDGKLRRTAPSVYALA